MSGPIDISLAAVAETRKRIAPYVRHTPMAPRPWFSDAFDPKLLLKLEHLQVAGSFKTRGAFNNLLLLSDEERARGVIAASGGNHGYSLTYAAARLGVSATIVLPETATLDRVQKIASLGGTVVPHGKTPSEAIAFAAEEAAKQGKALIHPFEGMNTWNATGTLGLEILEDVPDVDCLLIAIGGGGLIGGVSAVVKQLKPTVKIFGIEPRGAATMYTSIKAGRFEPLASVNTIADTLSPRSVGEGTLELARRYVDSFELVSDGEILDAMKLLWREYNQLVEPAGAAVLAAIQSGVVDLSPFQSPVAVICGGNAAAGPTFEYYASRLKAS